MAETQKQEWSKERIQAEMKDLEKAGKLRLAFGLMFGLFGVGSIVSAVGPFGSGVSAAILGIALVLVAIPFLRSGLAKRRQRNELKGKL